MKKSDLKNGNVVELRNGDFYVLANVYNESILIKLKGKYHFNINNYSIDLIHILGIEEFDIMKVYKDYTCKELLWERKETPKPNPKLTEDEKAILKVLLNEKFKWIAREDDEMLVVFERKPHKEKWVCSQWACDEGSSIKEYMEIFSNLFQFIQWEDEEPYSIEELLEREEK